jgi:hypothetical protein
MTPDELIAICDNFSFKDSTEPVKALRAVLEHLKNWRDWETRWKGHMSMTIVADEERNAKYRLMQELTAIIEKELG